MPHSCHQHEHFTLNNMSDSLLKIQSKTVKIYFFKHSKWIKKIYNSAITTVTKNFVPTLKLLTIPDQFITTMKAGCISHAVVPVRVVRNLGIYLDSDLMMRPRTSQRLFRAVLRCWDSFAASGGLCQIQSCSHLSWHWCSRSSTTAAPHWQDCLPFSLTGYSRCWMQLRD